MHHIYNNNWSGCQQWFPQEDGKCGLLSSSSASDVESAKAPPGVVNMCGHNSDQKQFNNLYFGTVGKDSVRVFPKGSKI